MTTEDVQHETSWLYDKSFESTKLELADKLKEFTQEQLIDYALQLHTISKAFYHCLQTVDSLGTGGYGGYNISSDFFPENSLYEEESPKGDEGYLWDQGENKRFKCVELTWDGSQNLMHKESAMLYTDTRPGDKCTIISTTEQAAGGVIFGGSIRFGDVRLLGKVLYNTDPNVNALLKYYKREDKDGTVESDIVTGYGTIVEKMET